MFAVGKKSTSILFKPCWIDYDGSQLAGVGLTILYLKCKVGIWWVGIIPSRLNGFGSLTWYLFWSRSCGFWQRRVELSALWSFLQNWQTCSFFFLVVLWAYNALLVLRFFEFLGVFGRNKVFSLAWFARKYFRSCHLGMWSHNSLLKALGGHGIEPQIQHLFDTFYPACYGHYQDSPLAMFVSMVQLAQVKKWLQVILWFL